MNRKYAIILIITFLFDAVTFLLYHRICEIEKQKGGLYEKNTIFLSDAYYFSVQYRFRF